MKLSMIGQEKNDLLIEVTVWAGLPLYSNYVYIHLKMSIMQITIFKYW